MADKSDRLPTTNTNQSEVDAFLVKLAAAPKPRAAGGRGRLIFAMDATASRQPTWDRACHIQAEMFEATEALGGVDVQLVFYRGFRECRASPFVSSARDLLQRMAGVQCLAGHTQIGRVLNHAAKETRKAKVNALVFVGDAFEEDVDAVGQKAGQLGLLGVPAFVFHEGGDPIAGRVFRQIATLTNGAYCPFDASSAKQLKDLMGAVAVYAAGGRQALEDYGRRRGGEALRLTNRFGQP
ncbi:MAG TPA: VWA domain-containing protein [Alphaproteobacteria bacterium]|nr:VWA domain-containing protein [Alphaproteobacteria bacterium]